MYNLFKTQALNTREALADPEPYLLYVFHAVSYVQSSSNDRRNIAKTTLSDYANQKTTS